MDCPSSDGLTSTRLAIGSLSKRWVLSQETKLWYHVLVPKGFQDGGESEHLDKMVIKSFLCVS